MEELLPFYESELAFLRGHADDFAKRYPKIAARLASSADRSEDPHVERMVQSFALLTSRINKKLDDDYPEFTQALLDILHPHYLRPFPACSIACFESDEVSYLSNEPPLIKRGTQLESRTVQQVACQFRTCYDVRLRPLCITDAVFHPVVNAPARVVLPKNATGSLSIGFEALGGGAAVLRASDFLRVFIDAEPSLATTLADALFLRTAAVYVEADRNGQWVELPQPLLREVGFDEQDALIELPARSHPAYRLLTEYFAFPEKFNFFDLDLSSAARHAGAKQILTLHFVLHQLRADSPMARLLEGVSSRNLRLGCTPIINLFQRRGEPIRVTHADHAYPVLASGRMAQAFEIYSIDKVHLVRETAHDTSVIEFRPFYSLHHAEQPKQREHYWFARRNERVAALSPGHEVELSLVDIDFKPSTSQKDTLSLALTCSNRDLPHALAFGLPGGDLFLQEPMSKQVIRLLRRPTQAQRIPHGKAALWRVISHLSLNHLSLVDCGLPALKEMLRLYERTHSAVSIRQIEGITAIEQHPAAHWLLGTPFATFVRGTEIRLSVDEASFVGSSLHAFGRMLDHFFGLYVHLNSFTELVIVSARSAEELMRCKPRSGDSILQ